jgi:hypothetical protein
MKTVYILGIVLIFVVLLVTYQSYKMSNLYDNDIDYDMPSSTDSSSSHSDQDIQYSKMPAQPGQLKIASQPDGSADASAVLQEKSSVTLYNDDQYVYNKGFINELIYKPDTKCGLPYVTSMIDNSMPLNSPTCQLSSDLPIANINVNYFIDKDTVRLR